LPYSQDGIERLLALTAAAGHAMISMRPDRSRPDIDPDRITVIGFSGGGRVGLMVAGDIEPDAPLPRVLGLPLK
jgi:hypothetical protein